MEQNIRKPKKNGTRKLPVIHSWRQQQNTVSLHVIVVKHLVHSSMKSPDGKKVSNFAILLVFPTTCHAEAVLELHRKIQATQDSINMDENDSLKLCCTKFIDFMTQKLPTIKHLIIFLIIWLYYWTYGIVAQSLYLLLQCT